ncbi:unnamed protein product [Knipowitschia caucasica]
MASSETLLQELREFRRENKEQFQSITNDLARVHTRLEEAEKRIEKTENTKCGGRHYGSTAVAREDGGEAN